MTTGTGESVAAAGMLPAMTMALARITTRPYRDDADWARLHHLLVRIYRCSGRWRGWTPDRIDGHLVGCLWEAEAGRSTGDWRDRIRLWETPASELVGAVHHEGPDEAWLEVDPAWEALVPEMLAWAEEAHRARHADDAAAPALQAYALSDDAERQALLASRGYIDRGPTEVLLGRPLAGPEALPAPPPGYRVRVVDLADPADRRRLVEITRLVFTPRFDERVLELKSRMLTQHEYLVAETDGGAFASWCGVWASPEIGVGQFEPVGTHPDHRRRGLASLVMGHGLAWMAARRLHAAFVGTGVRNPSNHLYVSLGFSVAELYHQWERPIR